MYFLSLSSLNHENAETEEHFEKFITNAETYLEPCQISEMELFGLTIFAKTSIIDFRLGSEYVSVMGEISESKTAFSKIPKILQEKTVSEYSFSRL